ncbi:hypothetical protein [Parasphingorhabdus sp.]|uniref:FliH/SctL family protein n=1 Tax=Parasphingorhabdus sp. TaxID=2709688 RepID=UPI003265EBA2
MTTSSETADIATAMPAGMDSGAHAADEILRMNVWNVQSHDRGFQPLYSGSESSARTTNGFSASPDMNATGTEQPTADQLLADAYASGFAEAERLRDATASADQLRVDELTTALLELKPLSDAMMTKMLLKSVCGLTEKMIGRTDPDSEFLKEQASKLGSLIQNGMRDAKLHVHPEDLSLFGEFECGVDVTADPGLIRGTLRLVHGDGWIEQGSQPLLDELQGMLDEMEQMS